MINFEETVMNVSETCIVFHHPKVHSRWWWWCGLGGFVTFPKQHWDLSLCDLVKQRNLNTISIHLPVENVKWGSKCFMNTVLKNKHRPSY